MIEHVVIGSIVFTRGTGLGALGTSWCRTSITDYATMTVSGAVFSVSPTDSQPVRVGAEIIGTTPTVHYRLSPRNGATVDYWIDNAHRIVSMTWDSDQGEHDSIEFYSYGQPIPPITAPRAARHC